MFASTSNFVVTVICGLIIAAGVVGILIPGIPGLLLSWFGVLLWAILGGGGQSRWLFVGIATAVALVGGVLKYALPGRNMKRTGVRTLSIVAGGVLGIIGFFVIPVIGLPIGFVVGVLLAEMARQSDARLAWQSTVSALKAVGLAVILEILFAFLVAVTWVVAVFVS